MVATSTEVAPPFDTHAVAVVLEQEGEFTPKQAGAVTEAIKTATERLATKADLKAELKAVEERLKTEIHKAINAQTWKMITAVIAWTAVVIAALRYLPPAAP